MRIVSSRLQYKSSYLKKGGDYEPFHALYRRGTWWLAIEAEQGKVIAWFPQVRVYVLTSEEVRHYDPLGLAFWNVLTPKELAQAEKITT